jgi:hypothetical protein
MSPTRDHLRPMRDVMPDTCALHPAWLYKTPHRFDNAGPLCPGNSHSQSCIRRFQCENSRHYRNPSDTGHRCAASIPRETIPVEGVEEESGDNAPQRRRVLTRILLRPSEVPEIVDPAPPETISAELFPPENWRAQLPPTMDVFLPRKVGDLVFTYGET